MYCGFLPADGEQRSYGQDEIDQKVESTGGPRTVNALDPGKNRIDKENIKKFLSYFDFTFRDRSKSSKGPDYFIIDNFSHYFKIEKADLLGARSEAEELVGIACN